MTTMDEGNSFSNGPGNGGCMRCTPGPLAGDGIDGWCIYCLMGQK